MKKVFVERQQKLIRIAVAKNNVIEDIFIEEETTEPIPGQIYLGIVKNVVKGISSAFIDIGYKKNCYMKFNRKNNNDNIKVGNYIIVQVLKECTSTKGPKVTNELSISGRYVVINNFSNNVIFSNKIVDTEFKNNVLDNILKLDDAGIIIRTKAQETNIENINYEIKKIYNKFINVVNQGNLSLKPKILYKTNGILDTLIKDIVDDSINEIIVNSYDDYEYLNEFITDDRLNTALTMYSGAQNIFGFYGLEHQIVNLRNNRVNLKSGGYIYIEKTEAMYTIDVNSGSNVKHSSIKKTAFATNMEAAEEISRQIKLRNLSGIIIIDFIDIRDCEYRNLILNVLRHNLTEGRHKTFVYPFTELNLVQISRQRKGKEILSYIEEDCSTCKGNGKRLKFAYIEFIIMNKIKKLVENANIDNIYIEVEDIYNNDIKMDILGFIKNIDALDKKVYVNYVTNDEGIKVEPLLFANQIKNMQPYKIYG